VNNNIKITLDLDGSRAFEAIAELENKVNSLLKETADPLKINVESPSVDEMKNIDTVSTLIKELNNPRSNNENSETGLNSTKNDLKSGENNFTGHQAKLTEIEKKYSAQRMKLTAEENGYKLANSKAMLLSAGELFGSQTVLFKTLSIAEATMNAYNAANAALLPPPVGAGPILGEIQAGIVLMNSLKRVEKIAAAQIPGYAKGGIVVGENGPEVIENMQDYASGRAELVQKTVLALQNNMNDNGGFSPQIINEIKNLRVDLNKILERPALAFLDDKEAKKVYYRGGYFARKTR
jgi:hypothetical protein